MSEASLLKMQPQAFKRLGFKLLCALLAKVRLTVYCPPYSDCSLMSESNCSALASQIRSDSRIAYPMSSMSGALLPLTAASGAGTVSALTAAADSGVASSDVAFFLVFMRAIALLAT